MRWRAKFHGVTALLALLLAAPWLWGQAFVNGAIAGNIIDRSGSAIPDVSLTLTNLGTGARLRGYADHSGFYQFLNLPPGRYRVDAEKEGFTHFSRGPIVVEVNNSVRIDITMEVGAVTQTVNVTGATPLLQPQTSSLGQVVGPRMVNELPLNGRNPLALAALVPGVVPQGGSQINPAGQNPFGPGNIQIGGGEANQNAAYWDGAPLNIGYQNMLALVPGQDAVQEFKVQTNSMSAEYSRFAGGVINLTTKSGTNQFHGSAYEFLRNKVLNANDFFDNASGVPLPPFTQNQFGATFGGPVVIPHVYNGHNRLFFFVSYEGFRQRTGLSVLGTVPTPAERAGDFSNLRDAKGNLIPIYDPTTTRPDPNNPGHFLRDQISCNGALNVICPQNIDPAAKTLANLWSEPNLSGQPFTNVNNWATAASQGGDSDQFTARVDKNVSDRQRIFARYTISKLLNLEVDPFHTHYYPLSVGAPEHFTTQQAVLDDSYSFSSSTIGDFNLSFIRQDYDRTPGSSGYDLTTLGWPAFMNSQVTYRELPIVHVQGIIGSGNQTGSNIHDHSDDYDFAPSISTIRGRHTLKFGMDLLVLRFNYIQNTGGSGIFNFTSNFTASDPLHPKGGNGFASFMLGDPASGSIAANSFVASQQIYRAVYAEDNIHATRKLTLNLGLRYEQDGPWSERFNRLSFFMPLAASPLAQATGQPVAGRLGLVASADRQSRNNIDLDALQFAPRVGFGYQLARNTVIRGGYGVFWLPNDVAWYGTSPNNDPLNNYTTPFTGSINGGLTPFNRLSNPFPNGIDEPPGRNPDYQTALLGLSLPTVFPNSPYAYAQQWNFDVQQQFPGATLVDLSYAGAKGTHLPVPPISLDQLPPQDMALGPALLKSVSNPFYGLIPSTAGGLAQPTVTASQLLRPYPQYSSVNVAGMDVGNSIYHSMQLKVQKQFSGGQTVLLAYTVSKLINNTENVVGSPDPGGAGVIQNYYDLGAERSLSSFDVPQRLVLSYVLDLPFGQGKRYFQGVHGIAGKLVSGWGVDGITTFQSGFPIHVDVGDDLAHAFAGTLRPNFDATACPHGAALGGSAESRLNEWFNTACFVDPPAFTFGNVGRNLPNVRADGINNWDFALFKTTTFGPEGKLGLQFRVEVFNLFNRPQFDFPDNSVDDGPQFGQVSDQANNPRLIQFGLRLTF